MTVPSTLDPTSRPEAPCDLERLVACFDDTRIQRTLGASGACVLALPARWRGGDPRRVELLPVANLLGWSAPASVDTLVFVGGGTATGPGRAVDPAAVTAGAGRPDGGPVPVLPEVEVVVAIDRSGRLAGRVRTGDTVERRPPAGGRLFDALHRCLGLATAAPAESTAGLLATLWLAAIAATGTRRGCPLSWADAVRCHPIAAALTSEDPSIDEQALEEAIVAVPRIWTWEALREATCLHGTLGALCPPELAGWMDEGMFSRWVSGSAVTLGQVVPDAATALDARAWMRAGQLLARSGVTLPSPGD